MYSTHGVVTKYRRLLISLLIDLSVYTSRDLTTPDLNLEGWTDFVTYRIPLDYEPSLFFLPRLICNQNKPLGIASRRSESDTKLPWAKFDDFLYSFISSCRRLKQTILKGLLGNDRLYNLALRFPFRVSHLLVNCC